MRTHCCALSTMRLVAHQQHGPTLRLVRHYSTLPEPPVQPRTGSRPKLGNFKAPVPSPRYSPLLPRSQQSKLSPRPLFNPTKETLDTTLKELNENCEMFKYESPTLSIHSILSYQNDHHTTIISHIMFYPFHSFYHLIFF